MAPRLAPRRSWCSVMGSTPRLHTPTPSFRPGSDECLLCWADFWASLSFTLGSCIPFASVSLTVYMRECMWLCLAWSLPHSDPPPLLISFLPLLVGVISFPSQPPTALCASPWPYPAGSTLEESVKMLYSLLGQMQTLEGGAGLPPPPGPSGGPCRGPPFALTIITLNSGPSPSVSL